MTTTQKLSPIQKYLLEEEGFYFAKVTMHPQGRDGYADKNRVDVYEGLINESDCGIIWMPRPGANMRSRFATTILTVKERVISVERVS
jgi:hypothetical protein